MSSYYMIVFGLKHSRQIYDCRTFIEQMHSLCIIIYEHNADIDLCERPGLHYHGIIELDPDTNINHIDAILQLKMYCLYFKLEICNSPEYFLLEMAQKNATVMIIEIANSLNLTTLYNKIAHSVGYQLNPTQYEKDFSKMFDVKMIMQEILNKRIFDPLEIYKQIQKNFYYYTFDELVGLVMVSISLVRQKILDQSILELCSRFSKNPKNYYTLQESIDLVIEWCLHQNIDIETFTMNWVNCLDRQVSYKNCMYFQESPECGVMSIIRSIADACHFTGEVEEETTGFTYFWKECVEKRCIILQEPIFDENMYDELDNILKGVGTIVPYELNDMKYLRPTPVIILSRNNAEECDLILKRLQPSFLHSYVNLKPFVKLHRDSRLLDPSWLNVLYQHFIDQKSNLGGSSSGRKNSEFLFTPRREIDLISPDSSVSSTTPYIGTPNLGCWNDS